MRYPLILLPILLISLAFAAPTPLYQLDFEDGGGGLPAGWQAAGGQWTIAADESNVLQQSQAAFRGVARVVMSESNYEVAVTARPTNVSGQWGVGVVGYWQPGGCYRLSNYGNVLALWREEGGQAQALAATRLEMKPQAYRLRLALQNEGSATTLRGKLWAVGQAEPDKWTITAQDVTRPLRAGRAGVFTGRAAAIFSDFAAIRLSATPAAQPAAGATAEAPPSVTLGNYWLFDGGAWQLQGGTLRQETTGSTLGFKSAAYAIASGWADHTVQVNARAASGSRNQGFGLMAYCQGDGACYELGQASGALVLSRRHEGSDPVVLKTVPFAVKKGLWYILKLSIENQPGAVQLQGKLWPANAGEPTQWQVEAQDASRRRLLGGDLGLWCLDDVCSFDDLLVVSN
ncbi:MAG: hypothetical protein ABFD96_21270 [Armatimonadia bacterium]